MSALKRPGISYRAVFAVFFGMLLVALTAGGMLYFGKLHYVPKATQHVPASAVVVARLSVERVGIFDPARTHLMPLMDSVGDRPGLEPRRARLERAGKLEFNVDLREVAVGLGPGPEDWVLVFGGMFPRANWLGQLAELFEQEGRRGALKDGVWSDSGGFVLAQASDGCVLVASSQTQLGAALPAASAPPGAAPRADIELWLRPGGAQWLRGKGLLLPDGLESLRGVAAGTGADLEAQVGRSGAKAVSAEMSRLGAENLALQGTAIHARLPREGLDRAAAEFAAWLKPRLGVASIDVGRAKTR